MKTWKVIVTGAILLIGSLTVVLAQTQGEMNREACNDYKKADAELNKVYQQVLNENKANVLFVSKLKTAQRAWIAYRDAHVESLYPAANPQTEYGSVYPMCHCSVLTDLTRKRTEELRRWVDGIEEGDVCSGSVKIKP